MRLSMSYTAKYLVYTLAEFCHRPANAMSGPKSLSMASAASIGGSGHSCRRGSLLNRVRQATLELVLSRGLAESDSATEGARPSLKRLELN